MPAFITEYPQFFTATILNWQKLLEPDKYKEIIINSMRFMVEDKRIKIYAFAIMSNHIHLIWQMQPLIHPEHVQRDFLKYTAQRIKHELQKNHPKVLARFEANANDRSYQFWKRRALSIELRTDKVYQQKLDYIHWNPVRAGICKLPEEYHYSSALFYHTGVDNPSASSGRISFSSSGLNYRSVVGGRKHQPRRKQLSADGAFSAVCGVMRKECKKYF